MNDLNRWTVVPALARIRVRNQNGSQLTPRGFRVVKTCYPPDLYVWRASKGSQRDFTGSADTPTVELPPGFSPWERLTFREALDAGPGLIGDLAPCPVDLAEWATATPGELCAVLVDLWGLLDTPAWLGPLGELARAAVALDPLQLREPDAGRTHTADVEALRDALRAVLLELREVLQLTDPSNLWTADDGWRTVDGMLWLDAAMSRWIAARPGWAADEAAAIQRRRDNFQKHQNHPDRLLRTWLNPERWEQSSEPFWSAPSVWWEFIAGELWLHEVRPSQERRGRNLAALERFQRSRTTPNAFDVYPLPSDRTAVRTATAITGNTEQTGLSGDVRNIDYPDQVVIQWADGAQLSLPFDGGRGPLLAVSKQYGTETLAHLWTLILLHWTSGKQTGDNFWWFASEHLDVMGLSGGNAYRRLWEHLRLLSGSTLTARYANREATEAPLASIVTKHVDGRGGVIAARMQLHPALTWPAAKGGGFWPAPLDLLSSLHSKGADGSAALAILMAQQWSITDNQGGAVFRKNVKDLAEAIGRPWRDDRNRDARTIGQIEKAADGLQELGFVERWELVDGKLHATPAIAREGKPPRPGLLPSTGHELNSWLAAKGGNLSETAKELGCSTRTLKRNVERAQRPLTPSMRTTLRRYLWMRQVVDI